MATSKRRRQVTTEGQMAQGHAKRQNILGYSFLIIIISLASVFVLLLITYLLHLCFEWPPLSHADKIESMLGTVGTFALGTIISPFLKSHGISGEK